MKRQQHIGELKAGVEVRIQQNNELLERAKEEIDVFARGNTPEVRTVQFTCLFARITLEILKMESWMHLGHTASIIIEDDIIHMFVSISKNMRILLMGRCFRQRCSGNIH